MYLGQVSIGGTWSKLEDLIKNQVAGQSSFSFDATKKYSIQCKSPNSFFIDEFTVNPTDSSTATAGIGESTGITEATVNKATFETQITTTGDYVFTFDGSDWKLGETVITLADYGIDITGTPAENDTITISYVADKWTLSDVEVDLTDYGITYTGTPDNEDTISVVYVEAVIGDMGNQIKEDDIIEYIVDTTNNPVLCVKAKNNVSFVNIDVLEVK